MSVVPIVVTAAQGGDLVTLDEAKKFCSVEDADWDNEIPGMIETAFGWLQPPNGVLANSIAPQTLCLDLPCWPVAGARLPAGPVTEISSVKYFDENNVEQTLDPSFYFADRDVMLWTEAFTGPQLYVRPGAVRIEYVAGLAVLPAPLRMAILRVVKQLFDYRDELVAGVEFDPVVFGVDALILPYRVR